MAVRRRQDNAHKCDGPCPFSILEKAQLNNIEPLIGTIQRPKRSILFEEGDSVLAVYLIEEGEVTLLKRLRGGGSYLLLTLRHGDLLGAEELLSQTESYRTTARVLEAATLKAIPRAEFLYLLESSREFSLEIMRRMALHTFRVEEKIRLLVEKSAWARLAEVFLELCERYGNPQGRSIEISIPLVNRDLAERVGVTPETISTILKEYKERRVVERHGRTFRILDLEGLRLMSEASSY